MELICRGKGSSMRGKFGKRDNLEKILLDVDMTNFSIVQREVL